MRRSYIWFYLCPANRAELQSLLSNRNTPRMIAWRAGIALATADVEGTVEIMQRTCMGVVQRELDRLAKSGDLSVRQRAGWEMSGGSDASTDRT